MPIRSRMMLLLLLVVILTVLQRRAILNSISQSKSTADITWICTDSQSSDVIGKSSSLDYLDAARARSSRFISVILTCNAAENARRIANPERAGGMNGKTASTGLLQSIRESSDIGSFSGEDEIIIDTSDKEAIVTAREVAKFVADRVGAVDFSA